ncbi:MFS transporter [Microbulbifer sp. CAU 1566]|uniref:MFS transporter n=1 Tax=unclassified Microbulbifer TaxID=2619833 RepID=UPI00135C7ADA|nr:MULTISPECIES: MFS transporter [unclassified Microbulbifer]MCK7598626.1 MFS transporter [Microbulbifer sp. CAU 1566]
MSQNPSTAAVAGAKPQLSFWQIWNMCFGFLGIQFGFALQNANVSRIFQTLGAEIDDIPVLWVAAPLTGLLVQPLIGYFSDRTWTGFGRRRPFLLAGAILSSIAILFMPHSPTLWIAAGMLWVMDASINVSMEPFRALVGDMLPQKQRSFGYALQSFFIGVSSVVASAMPWMLANWFDVSNTAPEGVVPDSVRISFYVGGIGFLLAVLWSVFKTREYSPEQQAAFESAESPELAGQADEPVQDHSASYRTIGGAMLLVGAAFAGFVWQQGLDQQLYILAGLIAGLGALQLLALVLRGRATGKEGMLEEIVSNLYSMPDAMKRLAWVQFFSWFALFAMWIYTTAAVTSFHFGTSEVTSQAYNDGADWVGILFATYNGFAALAALLIPVLARRLGMHLSHSVNLALGGLGLLSFLFIRDPQWLLLPMLGVGFAWASILSLPYAMLSTHVPQRKMGVMMGIFNGFIVIPQLLAASVLGFVLRTFFDNEAIYALVLGGISWLLAAVCALWVSEPKAAEAETDLAQAGN